MKDLSFKEINLSELDNVTLCQIDGGMVGAGPTWWSAMSRAMFLSRTFFHLEMMA